MDTKENLADLQAKEVLVKMTAEPVRKELLFSDVADEPCWISLKAERVQVPAILADEGPAQLTSAIELTVSQKQPMTIETLGTVIKLHGTTADTSAPEGGKVPSSTGQPKAA